MDKTWHLNPWNTSYNNYVVQNTLPYKRFDYDNQDASLEGGIIQGGCVINKDKTMILCGYSLDYASNEQTADSSSKNGGGLIENTFNSTQPSCS